MTREKSEKPDKAQFDQWLQQRTAEAKLKPGELAEFTRWLDARSAADATEDKANKHNANDSEAVSAKEFVELVSWLKSRIKFGREGS